MRRTLIVLGFAMGLVAACSGSAATSAPQASGTQAAPTQAGASQGAATPAATNTAASTPAGPPKQLDACSLVTAAEVAAVLGKPVDPGTVPEGGAHSCLFTNSATSTDSVEISITSGSDFNPTQKSDRGLDYHAGLRCR